MNSNTFVGPIQPSTPMELLVHINPKNANTEGKYKPTIKQLALGKMMFLDYPEMPREPVVATKSIKQGKVAVTCDGVGYPSICAAMKAVGISDATPTNWTKIRNGLKKVGTYTLDGHTFKI